MTLTTVSSRDFNQDTGKAKKASRRGPVIITDRGRPAHVLLSIEHYEALAGPTTSIVDLIASRTAAAVAFDPPKARRLTRVAKLT